RDGVRRGPRPELREPDRSRRGGTGVVVCVAEAADPRSPNARFASRTLDGTLAGPLSHGSRRRRRLFSGSRSDEQDHGATLLLLGKRAVLAHLFPSPLAASWTRSGSDPPADAARGCISSSG